MVTLGICRVCQGPAMSDRSTICRACWLALDPAAVVRQTDTQHARDVARANAAYDKARRVDEADAPPKRRGRD